MSSEAKEEKVNVSEIVVLVKEFIIPKDRFHPNYDQHCENVALDLFKEFTSLDKKGELEDEYEPKVVIEG